MQEEHLLLVLWLTKGSKWREIATLIEGRTESQVKNRFNLILRRERFALDLKEKELKDNVVPSIISKMERDLLVNIKLYK